MPHELDSTTRPSTDQASDAGQEPPPATSSGGPVPHSAIGHLWQRLDAMDFINRGMLFAAVLLLTFIPFVIIVQALAGRSATDGVVRRFGLDQQAAKVVSEVFASPSSTSSALTAGSYILFVLGGLAAAGAIQGLWENAYGLESRGLRDTGIRLVWLAVLVGVSGLVMQVGPTFRSVAGPVLLGLTGFAFVTGFWWFSMWLLLGRRRSWKTLFPSALATGVCWMGMTIVFSFTMSDTIVTNDKKYGYIGVVLALMSFLIAVGVVIILGAIVGVVWQERRADRPR